MSLTTESFMGLQATLGVLLDTEGGLLDTDDRGKATSNVHARAGCPSQAVRPHWDVAATLVHVNALVCPAIEPSSQMMR